MYKYSLDAHKGENMQKRKSVKGFSLIELIISISILVILTGLLAPQFTKYIERAKRAKIIQELDTIAEVLETSYIGAHVMGKENGNSIIIDGEIHGTTDLETYIYDDMVESLGAEEVNNLFIRVYPKPNSSTVEFMNDFVIVYKHTDADSVGKYDSSNGYYYRKGLENEKDLVEKYPGIFGEATANGSIQWK